MNKSIKSQRLFFLIFLLIIVFSAWLIFEKIERESRLEVGQSLQAVLDSTHVGIKTWARENKSAAQIWANYPAVVYAAKSLVEKASDRLALLSDKEQINLRRWFEPLQQVTGYQGYFIIDKNNINLASSRDQNVGLVSLLVEKPEFLQKIWLGEAAVSHPYISDVPLPDQSGQLKKGLPTMFVGAPIYNENGNVIAAFTFRLNPSNEFSNLIAQGRIGKSGETYVFDNTATMMSDSRFQEQLRQIGLLSQGQRSILNIELRDPGFNLIEKKSKGIAIQHIPFTFMAKQAIRQVSAMNLTGYRDYRGVSVVGAWMWDEELGYGLATEQDFDEAFKALMFTRNAIIVMSALLILLLFALIEIATLQQKRKMAERSSQALLEAGPDAIVVVNQSGEITFINDQATKMLGYNKNELLGLKIEVLLLESMKEGHVRFREKYSAKPYRRAMGESLDLIAKHKNGSEIPVEISLSPFETEQGVLIASAIRDVSRRKKVEKKLLEYRDQLESLVLKRTADLEASNKELESYSYSIAHDLRTPLRSITSFSQILKEQIREGSTSDNVNMLNRIAMAGEKMAKLIDDILQLSRFTRHSMNVKKINLSDISMVCIKEIEQLNPDRVVNWRIEKNIIIDADLALLTVVMQNLLENAWKYTSDCKNPEIELGKYLENNKVVCFVKDNGIGFNMEFNSKLFKPFHKLHPQLDTEGTGIGLATVQRIIQRHGGEVWAESSENEGATFYFSLPLLKYD